MDLHLKKTGGKKPSEGEGQETKKPKPCVNSLHDNDITRNGHRINRGVAEWEGEAWWEWSDCNSDEREHTHIRCMEGAGF